jgi:RNA-binding protein
MDTEQLKKLKSKARLLEPAVRIGKNGLTDAAIQQVRKLVIKRKLVKVKFLRSFLETQDKKTAAKRLAEATGSELIGQVGFVVVLYKR